MICGLPHTARVNWDEDDTSDEENASAETTEKSPKIYNEGDLNSKETSSSNTNGYKGKIVGILGNSKFDSQEMKERKHEELSSEAMCKESFESKNISTNNIEIKDDNISRTVEDDAKEKGQRKSSKALGFQSCVSCVRLL